MAFAWAPTPLPYWENGAIKIPDIQPEDQKHLTARASDGATRFIRAKAGKAAESHLEKFPAPKAAAR